MKKRTVPSHFQSLSRPVRTLSKIFCSLLIVTVLGIAAALLNWHLHGQQVLSVQTASMVPTFRPGDAVIVDPTDASKLQPGQVISYQSPADPQVTITHRLMRVDQPTGWLTTQGDALDTADSTFPPRLVLGQVTTVVPHFGLILNALRRPLGLALLVYLPALIIIASEVKRLARCMPGKYYRLAG